MADEEMLRAVGRLEALLRIAFSPQLAAEGERLRAHPVDSAILERVSEQEWIETTALQSAVSAAASKSTRTVRQRLSELTARGVLETRREGVTPHYRSTGLVRL
jgi:DNA-binding transcriptional ArsR family regulator